ncbi:MAG: tRNA 2-thiouridine(34) synthase MnmA [Dehalococcoidales bacterium]|nr:tRNA 2-thiouridine(34) synthase MnmA [Dehalococcoidales bacterium]
MSEKNVFVAMSGGVDSSLSAYLLKKEGYRVSGIHLEIKAEDQFVPDEHADLEETCQILGIPLHYLHVETEFRERVIEYFCEEYAMGRTPNPCIWCNRRIKFGILLNKILEMGGDFLATGHYARIKYTDSLYHLLKGVDRDKDQSYFLYVLDQSVLSRIIFPLGGMYKDQVKNMAADLGLPAVKRQESQDICFLPDQDYASFVARHRQPVPGEIVDTSGGVLGRHRGLIYYTVGQRQGIGLGGSKRMYVIRKDAATNRLIVGSREELYRDSLIAENLNWISGMAPTGKVEVTCKIRYRSPEVEATVEMKGALAEVRFKEPQLAIAPGQSIVFYCNDEVIGGGIIAG